MVSIFSAYTTTVGGFFRNNSSNSTWNARSNHRLGAVSKHSSISVGTSLQQQQQQNQLQQQRRSVRQTNPGLASSSGLKSTRSSPPPSTVTAVTNRQSPIGGSNISTRGGANRIIHHDIDISTRRKTRSGGTTTGGLNTIIFSCGSWLT